MKEIKCLNVDLIRSMMEMKGMDERTLTDKLQISLSDLCRYLNPKGKDSLDIEVCYQLCLILNIKWRSLIRSEGLLRKP